MKKNSKLKIENCCEQNSFLILIRGDVQGVFYRHNAKKIAEKVNVKGWIKNNQDGTVEAFIQGQPKNVEEFVTWCKVGSPLSIVESVSVEIVKNDEKFNKFEVR
ncbi:MAG: acylphosphatase [Patescibacteria group bacterium]|nr:acylphosphatase [Patescibacteria group bacterium]